MDNENDVNLDTLNETVEETVENPDTPILEETLETPEIDVEQLQATNKKLYERAKKAEAELKTVKGNSPVRKEAEASPDSFSVEETVLLANGMNEQLLEKLKKVAKLEGLSLIKTQANPIFVAVKERFELEQKQKKASLGASRGSGNVEVKKDFRTPNLTREEHKKMVQSI